VTGGSPLRRGSGARVIVRKETIRETEEDKERRDMKSERKDQRIATKRRKDIGETNKLSGLKRREEERETRGLRIISNLRRIIKEKKIGSRKERMRLN
jgi:hypothetical protein